MKEFLADEAERRQISKTQVHREIQRGEKGDGLYCNARIERVSPRVIFVLWEAKP